MLLSENEFLLLGDSKPILFAAVLNDQFGAVSHKFTARNDQPLPLLNCVGRV